MDETFVKQDAVDTITKALNALDQLGEFSRALAAQQALTDLRIYAIRLEGHVAALQDRIAKAARALGATL